MKRNVFIAAAIAVALALCACADNAAHVEEAPDVKAAPDGVTAYIKGGSVTPTALTLVVENRSEHDCMYGDDFRLDRKSGEKWECVRPIIKNHGFHAIGYELGAGISKEIAVDWEWLYGALQTGEYRIVKGISQKREWGGYDPYELTAGFIIK